MTPEATVEFLRRSPFFEPFPDHDLLYLSTHARLETYTAGELLGEEDEPAHALFLLVSGTIRLSAFHRDDDTDPASADQVLIRDVVDPGYPVGWSAVVAPHRFHSRITALDDVTVLAFDRELLESRSEADPHFGIALMERALWVVGRRLRETWIRLISRRYDDEVWAIRALLSQNADRLRTDSPLHKIPHYLAHRLMLADAFDTLRLVRSVGDERERDLAAMCLSVLASAQRELDIYRALQDIYETVLRAPVDMPASELNELACRKFADLFSGCDHRIIGEENLPEGSGHLFITNHLNPHANYGLPNGFGFMLDTNFIASMVVQRHYGVAPLRVVRRWGSSEFGHKHFFDRINLVYVPHGLEDSDARQQAREQLFQQASQVLSAGRNLVYCPEGAATSTEESPLPFKTGFLKVAARTDPEPLVVPVVLANLDKKLSSTTLVAVIKKPFRISERLALPADDVDYAELAAAIRAEFRAGVAEAVQLAHAPDTSGRLT